MRAATVSNAVADTERTGGRAAASRRAVVRRGPAGVALIAVAFALIWVLFAARTCGESCTGLDTTFGSAVHDPHDFLITLLNAVTAAGLYFVVASGFTLIFGLMRVVNMAHGAFFLLGGLHRAQAPTGLRRRRLVLRAAQLAGQLVAMARARLSSQRRASASQVSECSSFSFAGTRVRSSVKP